MPHLQMRSPCAYLSVHSAKHGSSAAPASASGPEDEAERAPVQRARARAASCVCALVLCVRLAVGGKET